MKRIGERIKKHRRLHDITLGDLAAKVGITPSALSQIENAKAFPSIITLKSIAENLHTTVGELIGENEAQKHSPISKYEDYKLMDNTDYLASIYHIPNEDVNKQMDTYLIELKEGESISDIFSSHSGQRMLHVLDGTLTITIDESTYEIDKNDSAFFHAKNKNTISNKKKKGVKMLLIIAPAN